MGDEVWCVASEVFEFGSFDHLLAQTLIALIPKVDVPTNYVISCTRLLLSHGG